MFNNEIVGSDAFLEMPQTTQNLYFHLGMRCDDDGFVNPAVTMRMVGANKNDLDVLVAKRFILIFKNGVVVIKHHRINNNWDSRDCRRTLYTEELRQLFIKENNSYTLDGEQGVPVEQKYIANKGNTSKALLSDGNPTETRRQNRIEENRIEENRVSSVASATPQKRFIKPTLNEVKEYCIERKNTVNPQKFIDHYESNGWRVGRNPMKDWKASVRTWERNTFDTQHKPSNVLTTSHSNKLVEALKNKADQNKNL